jgi:hypothetical protein
LRAFGRLVLALRGREQDQHGAILGVGGGSEGVKGRHAACDVSGGC